MIGPERRSHRQVAPIPSLEIVDQLKAGLHVAAPRLGKVELPREPAAGDAGKKPQRRWLEQDPERVRAWLVDEYPKIKARAREEGALVLFGDEMGVRAGRPRARATLRSASARSCR